MTDPPSFPFPAGPGIEPPAEYAEALRQPGLAPVRLHNGCDAVLVTRYQQVRAVLSDRRFSRSAFAGQPLFSRTSESLALVTSDPPVHTRRRAAVAHAFTPRAVAGMRPMVAELAARQVAELAAGPCPTDLVAGFTVPFAVGVMCRILGVPDRDLPVFKPWVDRMMSVSRFSPEEITEAHQRMHDHFDALVDSTEASVAAGQPADGLIAELVSSSSTGAPEPDTGLSRAEVVTLAAGLLMAGYETTSNVLATAVYELLRRPALRARISSEPESIGPVVEELLRVICLIGSGGPPHVATTDVTLPGGVPVRAGQVVVPVGDAANRDPSVYGEPNSVRVDRPHHPHLAFGYGPHFCLGAELARLELRLAITALLDALPDLGIAVGEDQLRWRTDMFIRGLWTLPVRW